MASALHSLVVYAGCRKSEVRFAQTIVLLLRLLLTIVLIDQVVGRKVRLPWRWLQLHYRTHVSVVWSEVEEISGHHSHLHLTSCSPICFFTELPSLQSLVTLQDIFLFGAHSLS